MRASKSEMPVEARTWRGPRGLPLVVALQIRPLLKLPSQVQVAPSHGRHRLARALSATEWRHGRCDPGWVRNTVAPLA
jgi:hypothetical protein